MVQESGVKVATSVLSFDTLLCMCRDTAKYPPLMKTSKLSNSLKYLAQAYLGYVTS